MKGRKEKSIEEKRREDTIKEKQRVENKLKKRQEKTKHHSIIREEKNKE